MTTFSSASPGSDTIERGFVVRLPPRTVSIACGRSIVRRVVTFRSDDAASAFLIAFTEIFANAIDEHARIGSDESITVGVHIGEPDRIEVTDAGDGIEAQPDVSRSDRRRPSERGRGLALARAFVPTLSIETGPTGTSVTLPLEGLGIVR